MPTRRHFLGAAAAGALPLALMPAQPSLLAQDMAPPAPGTHDGVLRQLATELARLHRGARTPLPRGEHYRATAATLRVLAAVDLGDEVRRGLTQLVATRGRAWVLTMPVDEAEVRAHLAALGAVLEPNDLRVGLDPAPDRARALDTMLAPGYDFADTLRGLGAALDMAAGDGLTGIEVAPRFSTANFENCIEWHQMLIVLQFGLVVLCASGNAPGCAATAASIALIQSLLLWAGC